MKVNIDIYAHAFLISISIFAVDMTQCQDEVRILYGRTQKLKVAKRCWKQLNEHFLHVFTLFVIDIHQIMLI